MPGKELLMERERVVLNQKELGDCCFAMLCDGIYISNVFNHFWIVMQRNELHHFSSWFRRECAKDLYNIFVHRLKPGQSLKFPLNVLYLAYGRAVIIEEHFQGKFPYYSLQVCCYQPNNGIAAHSQHPFDFQFLQWHSVQVSHGKNNVIEF